MRVSKRFPVAVHTLLVIARFSEEERASSAMIAQSTGTNAVIIRGLFTDLKAHGLIRSVPGKHGGAVLARDVGDISLWDVYCAVETDDIDEIFKFHEGSGTCGVGRNIYGLMVPHMQDAIGAMRRELERVTLHMLIQELQQVLASQEAASTDPQTGIAPSHPE